ncbi:MAG: N-acyl homoserine lactonase family protein [Deltaproteobacteria bacterium]|nr:N-acyl homoserine lactonase family protein [Deltaproteobacteria bacterium]MBW1815852.1 N-acyl homoserine lactonase family protein [Deltaproteobacteria bacterium]MBW2284142.1 N-acyl homoserine lactonase family protein [Deltaproteobacteria bacterium]
MSYTIKPLMLGKMKMNKSMMTYMMNFEKEIWIPIVSWYVKVNDKHLLVDTGAPPDMMRRYWYNDYEELISFEDALESVGATPETVDVVIHTHLHFDHCGNTPKCKNAEVFVQEEELSFSRNPHPLFLGSYLRGNIMEDVNFKAVEGDAELFPGIQVFKVPGHSPGTQAVSFLTSAGNAVLSGFCSIKDNFSPPEKMKKVWPVLTPGVHIDSFQAFAGAMRVKDLADVVIPTHDMDSATKPQIP